MKGMKQYEATINKIRENGLTVTYKRETEEYRVNWKNGKEATATYENSIEDAIATATYIIFHATNTNR
jgi:hypothetical protein